MEKESTRCRQGDEKRARSVADVNEDRSRGLGELDARYDAERCVTQSAFENEGIKTIFDLTSFVDNARKKEHRLENKLHRLNARL